MAVGIEPVNGEILFISKFYEMSFQYTFDLFHTFSVVRRNIKREVGRGGRHVAGTEREGSEPGCSGVFRFNFMPEMPAQLADVSACRFGGDDSCCCVHVSAIKSINFSERISAVFSAFFLSITTVISPLFDCKFTKFMAYFLFTHQ